MNDHVEQEVEPQDGRPAGEPLAVVLFADVCDSVRLYQSIGDAAALDAVVGCLNILSEVVQRHCGRVVRRQGDGILAAFVSAAAAVRAAAEMQDMARSSVLDLSIGLNYGPIAERDGDIYGDAVNLAARVRDLARAGEVLMTEAVHEALPGCARTDLKPFERLFIRGRRAPVAIYVLRGVGSADQTVVGNPGIPTAADPTITLQLAGSEFRLTAGQVHITIGRSPECDIMVPAPLTSRRHAVIDLRECGPVLVDQSSNGTFVQFEGGAEQTLRRGAVPLVGHGWIGCGSRIAELPENLVIRFRAYSTPSSPAGR